MSFPEPTTVPLRTTTPRKGIPALYISPPMKETSVSSSMDPGQRIRWISGRTRMSMSTIWVSPCQEVRTATLTVLTRGRRMGR